MAWVVGGILILAALAKSHSPWPVHLVLSYAMKHISLTPSVATTSTLVGVLIFFEIALGGWLLTGWRARTARRVALCTLGAFTIFLIALVFDPAAPPCACAGGIKLADDAQTANLMGVGRNLALMSLVVWAGGQPSRRFCESNVTSEATSPSSVV